MPIDASIPLGFQSPEPMKALSDVLTTSNQATQLKTYNINLQEKQGLQQVLSDPSKYTDAQGNIDWNSLQPAVMKVAPTTGAQALQGILQAQQQATAARTAVNSLDSTKRTQVAQFFQSLSGQPPDQVMRAGSVLRQQFPELTPMIDLAGHLIGPAVQSGDQAKIDAALAQVGRMVESPSTQQSMRTPAGVQVSNGQTTAVISTKPDATTPQGQALPGTVAQQQIPVGSQEEVQADAQGNRYIVQRSPQGVIVSTRAVPGASNSGAPGVGPVNLPPNETPETRNGLQAERDAARATASAAPVMHDINRTISQEVDKGLNTGTLGQLIQKVRSATGFNMGSEAGTDYNVLGKMLERSALTAAQGMGPHTNAGLEAQVRANGSLEYTPQAIKKIASLNDAIVTGAQLYQQGLEKAISSDPNGLFAKRKFDQDWARAFDPQVMRLKNAVDNGSKSEIDEIVRTAGGKGSKGANALAMKYQELMKLAGQ